MLQKMGLFYSFFIAEWFHHGFPWWPSGKECISQEEDTGLTTGSGRTPGEGNGTPLQYSCLGNSMDRAVWRGTVHGVEKQWDMT